MKKLAIIGVILAFALLSSLCVGAMAANGVGPNAPANYMLFTEDTAGSPGTVDPSIAYDTASGGMIFNVYDTLITFNGEHLDQYVASIADQWWSQNASTIGQTTSPEGLTWYWRYTFHIKSGITFVDNHDSTTYPMTTEDIQYSFWRTMILDASGGPEWMIDEPLLGNAGGPNFMAYNLATDIGASTMGKIIEHSVGRNATYVWFNLAFPGAYGPYMQILAQTWSSIMCKQYIIDHVIGEGINDWSGDWSLVGAGYTMAQTGWMDQFDKYTGTTGPLDVNYKHMCGTGPFMLTAYNTVLKFWTMTRNTVYFRGWPADFPVMATVGPAGYANDVRNNFGLGWAARKADLLAGACDFVAVPRANIGEVYQSPTPPFNPPTNYPKDSIRVTPGLPTLQVDAMYFTFDIDPSTLYGPVYAPGVFTGGSGVGIPSDFYSNAVWGIHMRKAFAYVFDYSSYIATAFYGEAQHVYTALIPGLPYYDPAVIGYDYNPAKALAELQQVPGIWANGFQVQCLWNTGNLARHTAALLLQSGMAAINSTFVVNPQELDWGTILAAIEAHQVPLFIIGWLADFPDMHDFALPFYSGVGGTYPIWANWDNATLDAEIDAGIKAPDAARQAIYTQIAKDVIAFCPNVALEQPVGRHFDRDWNQGWYYNSVYPDIYYYNIWKWWYLPQSLQNEPNPPTQTLSDQLGADVNYDGVVNMKDVGTAAHSFGALRGPPIDPTWIFRCDTNLDGIINMKDIGYVARNFNATRVYTVWHYP